MHPRKNWRWGKALFQDGNEKDISPHGLRLVLDGEIIKKSVCFNFLILNDPFPFLIFALIFMDP